MSSRARRGWLAWVLLLVAVLSPAAAAPPVEVAETWPTVPLRVGEAWRVRVASLDDFVVLDPHVLAAHLVEPDVLEVRGLRNGFGVLLILDGGETRAVAITVEAASPSAPSWDQQVGPTFQSQTIGSLGQFGEFPPWWRLWQQVDVTDAGLDPERSTTARAAVAAQYPSDALYVPLLGLELVRPGVRVGLGDSAVTLVPDVAVTGLRGAVVEVDANESLRVDTAVGATARATCCSFVDPAGEVSAVSTARLQVGPAPWVETSMGFLVPLQTPGAVGFAAAGAGVTTEHLTAEGRLSRLGDGWAATTKGAARLSERLDADLRLIWTSPGIYLPRQGPTQRSSTVARSTWTWRPTEHVRLQPLALFSRRGDDGLNPRRDQLGAGLNHSVRAEGGEGVDAGVVRTWIAEVGEPLDGLTSARLGGHTSAAARVGAHAQALAGVEDSGVLANALVQAGIEVRPTESLRTGPSWRHVRQGAEDSQQWVGLSLDGTWPWLDVRLDAGWWQVATSERTFDGPQWVAEVGARLSRSVHLGLVGQATHIPDTRFDQWRSDAVLTVRGPARLRSSWVPFLGGRIEGSVFLDADADGVQDPGEDPLEGVAVEAFGRQTRTDASGRFLIPSVPAGPKEVTIDRGEYHTVDGVLHRVEVPRWGAAETTFALSTGASLQVRVFHDRDRDGRYDLGEEGIPAASVTVAGVGTDAAPQGLVDFRGLSNGQWHVSVDPLGLPGGWIPVAGLERTVVVDGAGAVPVEVPLMPVRSVAGRVWVDVNLNGTRDGADLPVAGAEVRISPSGEVLTTDAEGRFLLRDVVGSRLVFETRGARPREVFVPDGPATLTHQDLVIPETLPEEEVPAEFSGLAEVAGLRIDPPLAFVRATERLRLSVTATGADLRQEVVADDLRWIVSNDAVATVDADGTLTGLRTGVTEIIAEWRGVRSAAATVEVAQIALVGLRVSPSDLSMELDEARGISAQALYAGGSWMDATDVVVWTTSDPSVARVDERGIVHAVGPGTARVRAELQGQRTQPVLVHVGLERAFPQRLTIQGSAQQLSLTRGGRLDVLVRLADGRVVDGTSLMAFDVADPDVVRVLPGGRLEPLAVGTTEISARWKGVRSLPVTVEVLAAEGLLISPAPGVMPSGARVPLKATAVLKNGELEVLEDVSWEVSNPAVATIRDGVLEALRTGTAEVTATWRRQRSYPVMVEVVDARVEALQVTPSGPISVEVGQGAFVDAVATLSDGRTINATAHARFTVEDHTLLAVDEGGTLRGLAPGTTELSATWFSVPSVPVTVEVRDPDDDSEPLRVVVEPQEVVVGTGRTATLTARVSRTDGRNHPIRDLRWESADPRVALVDAEGQVRAVSPGTTTVVARFGDLASSPVTVSVPALAGMTISPPLRTVPVGTRIALRADGVLETGELTPLTGLVQWSSTDPDVARVEAGGQLLAIRPGVASVSAEAAGLSSRPLEIQVVDTALDRITVEPTEVDVATGAVVFLDAFADFGDGTSEQATHYASWSSSRPEVLDVVDGAAVAGRPGVARIYASWLGRRSEAAVVRVNHPDLVGLTVNAPQALLLGADVRPTVTAVLSGGRLQDVTDHVVWHVHDETVVTIDGGRLHARHPGATWLTASLGGQESLRLPIEVHGAAVEAVRIDGGPLEVDASGTVRPRVRVILAGGREVDGSDQVDWLLDGLYLEADGIGGAPGSVGTARARWGSVVSEPVEIRVLETSR